MAQRHLPAARGEQDMAIITGTPADDSLFGTPNDDTISGGGGHDYLRGNAGNDHLSGDDGDDYLDGGAGDDVLDGGNGIDRAAFHSSPVGVHVDLNIQGVAQDTGQGNDTLIGIENLSGTLFDDTLIGNGGDNWIWGEGGNDVISAGAGNDLVEVGPGNATADGGADNDTLSLLDQISTAPAGVTVSLAAQGAVQVTGEGTMLLTGFENVSGGVANDILTGDGGNNVLAGDLGNDLLSGGAGDDVLYGDGRIIVDSHDSGTSGPIATYADVAAAFSVPEAPLTDGDDILEGGLGDDVLWGGGGNDTASYSHASGAVQAVLGNGAAAGSSLGAEGNDTLHDIENITGSTYDDDLFGNNGANVIAGGDGADQIRGNGGDDSLLGGNGDDFLNGGQGNDIIDGGAGWDRAAFATGATAGVTVDLNIAGVAEYRPGDGYAR
jgi:Ca2+-binding RTX toxin-like protein